MLSVSPPQKGVAPEAKIEKDFRNTSADSKVEFEKALKEKMLLNKENLKQSEKNKQKQESKDDDKLKVAKNEDGARTEKKDKKSSGGIKKKMTDENDDKMVSNIMASTESEIEIPESKIDLAEIEIGIQNINQKAAEPLTQEDGALLSEEAIASQQAPQQPQFNELMGQGAAAELSEAPSEAQVNAAEQATLAQQSAQLEKELGEEVGFQPEAKTQAGAELVQKMKAFEAEKGLAPDKAQAFELAVLDQLKKQVSEMSGQQAGSDQSGFKDDSSKESPKELGSDSMQTDVSHHAGQSHTDFKASLATSVEKSSDLSQSKLEESYDKNIKEVMSQAKYLVTKGGGEMKVSMSPEGMGEVQLKVLLQDGKVNVEIQTQNKEVKKMIEDSLSELKSGLAAHRLSVEHVKIDTVNATNTDNNTHNQSNWNNGGSEGKQREFWNQFQQNLGQQQPGKSSYAGSSVGSRGVAGSNAMAAAPAASSALRTYGGTKGATINRVA